MKDLKKLSGNEMKMTTQTKTYRDYSICPGGLGFTYVHKDYDGVFEYEEGEPSDYDRRVGSARTIEDCKEEIDELEAGVDRTDDDFVSGLENERQNPEL